MNPWKKPTAHVMALAGLALLAACSREETKVEPVRPVRTIVVGEHNGQTLVLAGEIRARYETPLAFRVSGQLVSRRAEVGQIVKTRQPLAELDSRDLRLAASAARAQLVQAEAQSELAEADFRRYAELRTRNFISQAEFERRETQAKQAREQLAAARAESVRAANQAGYGVLLAPHGGVITAVEAETGQVVAAGQTVLRLARPEEKEVLVSLPEHRLDAMRRADLIEVRLWSAPGHVYEGRLRELSPAADPISRTYGTRIAIVGEDAALALGMSAEVRVHTAEAAAPRIPLTAVFHHDGDPAVWVVDGSPAAVRLVPVATGNVAGNSVAIISGLAAGQVVVTAGVQLLREGQQVSIISDTQLARVEP